MSPSQRSTKKHLEVTVMFEPQRFEQETMQTVYACLLPILRRTVGSWRQEAKGRTQKLPEAERRRS